MEEMNDDDIWGDEETEASFEEEEWETNDPFFEESEGETWTDTAGMEHELFDGELPDEAEYRSHWDTFEEATDYIEKILTGADIYFEIVEVDDGYDIYYMGGSE